MPRFRINALLLWFAVVALWLSTLTGFPAGGDLRRTLLLAALAAAGYSAAYTRGPQRAFWAGFFLTMLAHGFSLSEVFDSMPSSHRFGYIPRLQWTGALTNRVIPYFADQSSSRFPEIYRAIEATFAAGWTLIVSSIIGLIGLSAYNRCQKGSHT